jgi:beta-xylosidase
VKLSAGKIAWVAAAYIATDVDAEAIPTIASADIPPTPTMPPPTYTPTLMPVAEPTLLFRDDFDGALAAGWRWLRQDPTHWNLTDIPGYLRIVTQPKDIWRDNNSAPLLLQTFSADTFEIRTRIVMMPSANYHQGGLVIYGDDDNYVRFTFGYFSGRKFEFAKEIDGDFQSIQVPAPIANSFHLRLRKDGQDYTDYYSQDGKHWVNVGQHSNVNITPSEIGLSAFNAEWVTLIEIPADFDYFQYAR